MFFRGAGVGAVDTLMHMTAWMQTGMATAGVCSNDYEL